MRPVRVVLNAAGYSQWIPVDYQAAWFGVGVGVVLSEDANLTYTVQHTFDPIGTDEIENSYCTIARAGTVATVTDNGPYGIGHGLTTGDSVIISSSGSQYLDAQGPVYGNGIVGANVASTPTNKSFTYNVQNLGPTADNGSARIQRLRVFASTLAAQTVRGTVSYNYQVRAIRLYISTYVAGFADMTVLQGLAR